MKRYGREMKRLSPVQIQKELDLAGNLLRSGDANSALGKIDQVLRSNLDCDSAYFAKGRLLMTLSRASEALSAFAQAVRYNPRHFEALESAAQLSLGLRLPEQTESFASRLSQLQPENDQAYFLLSVAKSLKGRCRSFIGRKPD
jgi:tetratricopeptide (TPR) repeat protein